MNVKGKWTVVMDDDVHYRLKTRGRWGQSLSDVIRDLLDIADGKVKQQYNVSKK